MAGSSPLAESTRVQVGIRITAREQAVIAAAAKREQRSVSSFVARAALEAAQRSRAPKRRTLAQMEEILRAAQDEVRAANPAKRDLLAELIAERRAEAALD